MNKPERDPLMEEIAAHAAEAQTLISEICKWTQFHAPFEIHAKAQRLTVLFNIKEEHPN
jgi:hypothetical protein